MFLLQIIVACSTLVSLGSAASTHKFQLLTLSITGGDMSGLFIDQYHTAAGEGGAVGSYVQTYAPRFALNHTDQSLYFVETRYHGQPITAAMGIAHRRPDSSTAPQGYKVVTLNIALGTPGFSVNRRQELMFANDEFPDFESFAICQVQETKPDPYPFAIVGKQLLWRGKGTKPSGRQCSDVVLKAVY